MRLGAVTLMFGKAVLRVFLMQFQHVAVAGDFGHDGGELDGGIFFVALHDSF